MIMKTAEVFTGKYNKNYADKMEKTFAEIQKSLGVLIITGNAGTHCRYCLQTLRMMRIVDADNACGDPESGCGRCARCVQTLRAGS